MKKPVQPFPKAPFAAEIIGTVPRILDGKGRDVMRLPGGPERLVICANAFGNRVWFPDNHLPAAEARCERLEAMRKELWAEVQSLRAENEALRRGAAA